MTIRHPFLLTLLLLSACTSAAQQVVSLTSLSPQEIAYSAKRLSYIQNALPTNYAQRVPKIAVCASGGGLRAMIGTLGFYKPCKKKAF